YGHVTRHPMDPFFRARQAGLPASGGPLQSRDAGLEIHGPELLGLRQVHGSSHPLANRRVDLRSPFFQDGVKALFPGFVRRGGTGTCRHGSTRFVKESLRRFSAPPASPATRRFPPQVTAAPPSGPPERFFACFRRTPRINVKEDRPRTNPPVPPGEPRMDEEVQEFAALMQRLAGGSQEAARELYDRYGPHIRRVVRRRLIPALRPKFDSIDFEQDVWKSF